MRIHILDYAVIDKKDLCWDSFRQCGEVIFYENTRPEQFAAHAADADAIVVVGLKITEEMLASCPKLRYINLLSTGYDFVDAAAAGRRNILVSNISTYGTDSVAQFVFALLLELCHHVGDHDLAVRQGQWGQSGSFSFWRHPLMELKGKSLGIVGFGRIGQVVARIGHAYGMKILAFDAEPPASVDTPCQMLRLEKVLAESDIITLHCPLTEQTRGMIDGKAMSKMKRGALLINAARGGLVNEADLCAALKAGQLAGAALDVATTEPIPADSPLLDAPNLILTPHIAWATKEARTRMLDLAVQNQLAFQRGEPINIVNR